jgi:energy-converting hydrogenase Eha subunit A
MKWEDGVVYGLVLAGIYLLVGVLFFYAGKGKIFDGIGAPAAIEKQFAGTFLDTIPGVDAAWTILGVLEFLVFLVMVASLVRLEFLPSRRKPILLSGLALAIFTFSVLAIGQNVTAENSGVAELFLYAGATGVLIGLVLRMPPYRAASWISRGGGGR